MNFSIYLSIPKHKFQPVAKVRDLRAWGGYEQKIIFDIFRPFSSALTYFGNNAALRRVHNILTDMDSELEEICD